MKKLSRNGSLVFEKRLLLRDRENHLLETPEDLFHRVAKVVAGAELHFETAHMAAELEEAFFQMMSSLDFLPNSPTLMNAGTPLNQLSACFVLPVEDSLASIFETLKNAAIIQQSGGGTGFNFSNLRARGDYISKTQGEAAGPLSFMEIFDIATAHVKQGGKRRGANMGILNVDHPDIFEFVGIKKDGKSLTNFNISVGITDAFMQAVELQKSWELKLPGTNQVVKTVEAVDLWRHITEAAWECGDPGLIFLDEINRKNPTPALGPILATNPCGEVPLMDYEACNLGSINLSNMVLAGSKSVDWQKLKKIVHLAIRFLDNVIEVNNYQLEEIKKMALGNRKIGLGLMGWAELLIKLGIPYDSDAAINLGEEMMRLVESESFQISVELAKERGVFPNWNQSIYFPEIRIRNATRTSIAPTGTLSILANTTFSIEPLFALVFNRRNILEGENLLEINELLADQLKERQLIKEHEDLIALPDIHAFLPEDLRAIFRTALEVPWQYHLKHQLIFQKYTDNAVSKTINLHATATVQDVSDAYLMAWRKGAKGITIYRDRSKPEQVLYPQGQEKDLPAQLLEGVGDCKVCVL